MRANKTFKDNARKLRKNSTDAENYLWYLLRNRQFKNFKFRRQYIVHPYIVDFICISKRLIIEVDGSQHMENVAYDLERTRILEGKGYKVIRFWSGEIFLETDGVLESILTWLN